jgi:RNA polymerase sigma-70 factor (sigma-E family)
MTDEDTFQDFVTRQWEPLSRTAYLLTRDRALAEDLVQAALEKTHRHWRRIERVDSREVYTRRVMVNMAISWRRRRKWAEVPLLLGDKPGETDPYGQVDNREMLLRAMRSLPPRTQAVLVLRYFEDRSEAEIAQVLGCSPGSVKSQASRGIARLRALLQEETETTTTLLGGFA